MSVSAAAVIAFLESFDTDRNKEVSNPQKVVAELLIYESSVGEGVESYVLMFFAQFDYIVPANQRLASRKQISVYPKLFPSVIILSIIS